MVGLQKRTISSASKKPKSVRKRKNYLPKDDAGKVKAGPGRPKGLPNKITGEAKQMIALAFEGMGGLKKLIAWGEKNPSLFYTQVYTKLIPLQVQGKLDIKTEDNGSAVAALERIILGIRAARLTDSRLAEAPVIIDSERVRDTAPRLVVSSKAGATSSGDDGDDK